MKIIMYSMIFMQIFAQSSLCGQATIHTSVIGCGASIMSANNLKLVGTIGQSMIGVTNTSGLSNAQGFWQTYRSQVVKTTDIKLTNDIDVKLVPNPISTTGALLFELQEAQKFDLKLVNIMGLECRHLGIKSVTSGHQVLTFDFSDLRDGIYFIILRNQNNDIKIPFVKMD